MNFLDELNPAQREAAEVKSGPLLILAGAGSGKTKTLTYRIARILLSHEATPDSILAVTFTNKAAREMRIRLGVILHQDGTRRGFMPWMGTFHGICVRLLRIDGEAIGIDSHFVIYDESDRHGLVKRAIKELSIDEKTVRPRAASAAISSAKNAMLSPEEYAATAQMPSQHAIAKIYERYETEKRQAGALDFDDLLNETVRLLSSYDKIRQKWQTKFRHIMVDEYQDTNAAQYSIIKLLLNHERNICVVGDDWQSIYSWRGADFTNILNFTRDFPGAKVVKLEQNYRSTGNILDAASAVIAKNKQRTDKKLWTEAGPGAPIVLYEALDELDEARWIADKISSQVAIKSRTYGDYAILYRTNALSYVLERSLLQYHIPYKIVGGTRFYDRQEVKDILAYLKVLYQPHDMMSFARIVNVPKRGLGATSQSRFMAWHLTTGRDIISDLMRVDDLTDLTPKARHALRQLGDIIQRLQKAVELEVDPGTLVERVVELTGYREYANDGTPQAEERVDNLGSLVSDAKTFGDLASFLEEAALMSSADTESDGNKVTLMTLHAAKGLEFPAVFIVGLEDGILPHARVFDAAPEELEEERRLMYVGMTRAREELNLSYADSRMQAGQRSYNMPSRFLDDVSDYVQSVDVRNDYGLIQDSHRVTDEDIVYDDNYFAVGDTVRSPAFGVGEVVEADGMAVLVKFTDGKTKKLNVEYARLEKL